MPTANSRTSIKLHPKTLRLKHTKHVSCLRVRAPTWDSQAVRQDEGGRGGGERAVAEVVEKLELVKPQEEEEKDSSKGNGENRS